MRTLRTSFFALLLFAFVLGGCDSESGDGITTYIAPLSALNSSGASGNAVITVDNNTGVVSVDLDATGLDATVHAQHIHSRPGELSACPTSSADANSDGYVDVLEGLPSYGGILLPLDNDISTQEQNLDGFPEGTTISYSTSASLSDVESALIKDDSDTSDAIVTVGSNGSLTFQDFVIVVHGTTEDLPATVGTLPGLSNMASLPVACGRLSPE